MDSSLLTTTSSVASAGQYTEPKSRAPRRKLAIERESKIDKEFNKNTKYRHRPSTKTVALKWISTITLGLLLLGLVTFSKVSIIALSARMGSAQTEVKASQLFVMLQMIAVIPHVVCLIRGIFAAAFRPDIPWPRKKSLISAVFVSLLESIGLVLFIFKVPEIASPRLSVLTMSCVFIGPILLNSVLTCCAGDNIRMYHRLLFLVALILELVGGGITGYVIYLDTKNLAADDLYKSVWIIPVAIICLTIAWLPRVQSFLLQSKYDPDDNGEYERLHDAGADGIEDTMILTGTQDTSGASSSGYQGYSSNISNSNMQREYMSNSIQMQRRSNTATTSNAHETTEHTPKSSRSSWKLTIWMSFWKLIFTIGLSFLLYFVKFYPSVSYADTYWKGWSGLGDMEELLYLLGNIIGSILGYFVGYVSCTTCMQRFGFSLPLAILCTPLSFALLKEESVCRSLVGSSDQCTNDLMEWPVVALICLVLAQTMSTGWVLFRSQSVVLLKEDQLFWTPMYNPALLEQWLMLVRRNELHDKEHEDPIAKAKRSKIIICTTMYREADFEMRQLLESLRSIDMAQSAGQRHFESHVFFDGAVKDRQPTEFVLQLVTLVESVLGVKAEHCCKTSTPYGMSLTWKLKGESGNNGMVFKIHLKDNVKVKNKKRWSQVMYMSYVLDFLFHQEQNTSDEDWFILTTDADVRFTPDSVEALLDLMTRDPSVGAVCARTHPLGSGPLLWYQVFEYAIGHWFQKAAEHIIGSVLCSPGCFSVYRCKAIKDILPQYASNVEHAFDFLTKDMGEDRWFCTLLVQSGWRIEYCAASENSTHCPQDFDEFFKQRRRWVASTLANLMLLVKEWHIVSKLNHRVSFIFLLYQAVLLFATLIGPSSIILIVTGGLRYALNVGPFAASALQLAICVGYTMICLMASSDTQLNAGKVLTFIYALVMAVVIVGTAVQVTGNEIENNEISETFKISTTTLYLAIMVAVFLITGILHLGEFVYLLHGIWFFLCMPAGYLILTIYSICNITDRSWGTREVKTTQVRSGKLTWQEKLTQMFKEVFFCCFKKPKATRSIDVQTESHTSGVSKLRTSRSHSISESLSNDGVHDVDTPHGSVNRTLSIDGSLQTLHETMEELSTESTYMPGDDDDDEDTDLDNDVIIDVEEWLPKEMAHMAKAFRENGFDNTMLISKMTEKELKDLGVKLGRGMKQSIMELIKRLPDYEIQADVPENVEKWLESIGLPQYKSNFIKEQIKSSKDMEVLKSFGRNEIEKELKIKKVGHIKRLIYAIARLRNPTMGERRILEVKKKLTLPKLHQLKTINVEEYAFWDNLKNLCLLPQSTAYGLEEDLKSKLGELRNSWIMVFAVSNTLWMVLIFTLANQGEKLSVYGSNPVGLVILILFSFVLLIQFLAMIIHRVITLTHFLGRAPYKVGDTFNTAWAFSDSDMKSLRDRDREDIEAIVTMNNTKLEAFRRIRRRFNTRPAKSEIAPLLQNHGVEQV